MELVAMGLIGDNVIGDAKRTDETLNVRPADGAIPTLRLNVNHVESQTIFVDDNHSVARE
jgi:hypothetical protein